MKKKKQGAMARRRNKFKLRVMGVMALIAAILISLIPMPSQAEDVDDITWINTSVCDKDDSKSPKELILKTYGGTKANVVIPAYVSIGAEQYKVVLGDRGVFRNCSTLETLDLSKLDLSTLTDMSTMFKNCTNLKEVKFGANTLKNVTSMLSAFEGCTALETLDLTAVTPLNADNFSNTFAGCTSLKTLNLSTFETPEATDMSGMFDGCTALESIDLSGLKTSRVTTVADMFRNCKAILKLNLSGFDMTSVSSASGMLSGTQAEEINTPTNIKSNVSVQLPDTYTLETTDGTQVTELPKGDESITSVKLLGPVRVTDVTLDKSELTLTVGGTYQLIHEIQPDNAANTSVNWTTEDDTKVQVSADGEVTALAPTQTPVKVRVTTVDGEKTADCEVTVIAGTIPVTGVTLPISEKKILVGKTYKLDATVLPDNATDPSVKWFSSDTKTVSVDDNGLITAHKAGTAITVRAVAQDGTDKFAECRITAVESYTVQLKDERTDTSNGVLSKMELDKEPESDMTLTVTSVEGMKLQTLLEQREGYNIKDACFFKVSKVTDENGAEVNDYGMITLTLAMPGRLMNKGLTPRLYRYSTLEEALVAVPVTATELGNDYKIEAFRFDVKDATDDAQYAIVLETKTGHAMYVSDERSVSPQDASAAVTNMNSDLYFFVQDKEKPAIEVLINQNQNLASYKTREYYEMFITSDSAGKNKVDDFGICYITLTLPKEMDYTKGDIKVVSMQQNGNQMSLDTSFAPEFKTDARGVQYITIRTTHFSEYALLYLENQQQQQPGAGTSATTGTGTSQGTGQTTGQGTSQGTGTGASQGTGTGTSTTQGGAGQSAGTGASAGQNAGTTQGTTTTGTGSANAGRTSNTTTGTNSADMPTTGGSGKLPLYRNMGVILLALAGATMLIASKVI